MCQNYGYFEPQQVQPEECKSGFTSRNVARHHSVQKGKSSIWCPESYRGEDMVKVKILLLILFGCGNWYL
jgi:hypothetical protein